MKPSLAIGKAQLVLGLVLLGYVGLAYGLYAASLKQTYGVFIYPLDDAYIHLALARTLHEHGVWGVRPDEFSSVSSSVLWPLHLAALMPVSGAHEQLPLVLNAVYSLVLLVLAWQLLRARVTSVLGLCWPLLLLVLVPSLPLLVFFGMEHTLHAVLALAFAWATAVYLDRPATTVAQAGVLLLLAALVTGIRYESMLLVGLAALAALWQRRWAMAVLLPLAGLLPLAAFGAYSVSQQAHWLPNPILVKSDLQSVQEVKDLAKVIVENKFYLFYQGAPVTIAVLLAVIGLLADALGARRLRQADQLLILLSVGTSIGHMVLSRLGWYGRYEGYLLVLLMVANGLAWEGQLAPLFALCWPPRGPRALVLAAVAALLFVPTAVFLQRFSFLTLGLPSASRNICDQQVQLARFVKAYYDDQAIVINDLGWISWWTDARPVDMAGLATLEVAQAIIHKQYDSARLTQLARQQGARVAMVYQTPVFMPPPRPPAGWTEVGKWTIRDNIVCGDPTVYFFALDAEAAVKLERALRDFRTKLPDTVLQEGLYVQLRREGGAP